MIKNSGGLLKIRYENQAEASGGLFNLSKAGVLLGEYKHLPEFAFTRPQNPEEIEDFQGLLEAWRSLVVFSARGSIPFDGLQ